MPKIQMDKNQIDMLLLALKNSKASSNEIKAVLDRIESAPVAPLEVGTLVRVVTMNYDEIVLRDEELGQSYSITFDHESQDFTVDPTY